MGVAVQKVPIVSKQCLTQIRPVCACMHVKLLLSCPTLCDPMDCSPLGSSVHGILQARILEWVAIPCSRASSYPRYGTQVSCLPHWQEGSLPLAPPGKPRSDPSGGNSVHSRCPAYMCSRDHTDLSHLLFWIGQDFSADNSSCHLVTVLPFFFCFFAFYSLLCRFE